MSTPDKEWNTQTAREFWRQKNGTAPKGKLTGAAAKHVASNEVSKELALAALATCPTVAHASQLLKDQHGVVCTPASLRILANKHVEELEKLRERVAPRIERAAANNMLSNVWETTEVEQLAIERCKELLENNQVADPSKMLRDLSDAKAKNVDKRLALQGRPTEIRETRDVGEIVNALVAMKVAERVDVTAEDDDEDDGSAPIAVMPPTGPIGGADGAVPEGVDTSE